MASQKIQLTEGIVFRQLRFKETSLIADLFTKDWGLQSFVINGVFKKGDNRLASALQLMHIVEVQAYYHEQKTLHRIKELREEYIYQRVPFEIHRSAMGSFMLEVSRKSIRDHAPHESLYDFLKQQFMLLDSNTPLHPDFHLSFCVELLRHLGFQWENNYAANENSFDISLGRFTSYHPHNIHAISEQASNAIHQLMLTNNAEKLDQEQRRAALQTILQYFRFHIEHFGQVQTVEIFQHIL